MTFRSSKKQMKRRRDSLNRRKGISKKPRGLCPGSAITAWRSVGRPAADRSCGDRPGYWEAARRAGSSRSCACSPTGYAGILRARLPLTHVAKGFLRPSLVSQFSVVIMLCRVVNSSFSWAVARTKNSSDFSFQSGRNFLLSWKQDSYWSPPHLYFRSLNILVGGGGAGESVPI